MGQDLPPALQKRSASSQTFSADRDRLSTQQREMLMRRREFIAVLGSAVAAWPVAARAQQPVLPVVGLLVTGSADANATFVAAFRNGLGEMGFVESRNISIEYRYGQNDIPRLAELAADLVRRQVAVIATLGGPAPVRAAKAASPATPIIFETGGDPVAAGLVASLNRPGGTATGVAILSPDIEPKRLGLLHDLLPMATRFAALMNNSNAPVVEARVGQLRTAAAAINAQIEVLFATKSSEIDSAFTRLAQMRVDALLVTTNPLFSDRKVQLATLAARNALPAIYFDRDFVIAGGLMSYGPSYPDQARQVGVYVGRILKGEKPADLPVMRPTRFALVLNLQTAKTLGLQIPETLLATADEVIQ
jgi:putative tryptophan/tyrosine transport system substrate-binding protein